MTNNKMKVMTTITTFKIDNNVPLPPQETKHKAPAEEPYPFKDLQLNQSFFVPDKKLFRSILAHYSRFRQTNKDKEMLARVVKENEGEGVRVWRVK